MVIFIFMYNNFYESKRDFYNSTCPLLFPPFSLTIPIYSVLRSKTEYKNSVVLQIFEKTKNASDKHEIKVQRLQLCLCFLWKKFPAFKILYRRMLLLGLFYVKFGHFRKKKGKTRTNGQIQLLNMISNWFQQKNNKKVGK